MKNLSPPATHLIDLGLQLRLCAAAGPGAAELCRLPLKNLQVPANAVAVQEEQEEYSVCHNLDVLDHQVALHADETVRQRRQHLG